MTQVNEIQLITIPKKCRIWQFFPFFDIMKNKKLRFDIPGLVINLQGVSKINDFYPFFQNNKD
jgi:hypothetical protein